MLDSYSGLKTEIATWLDRDDLATEIDTFIDLAEVRHARDIRLRDTLTRADLTISDGDRYVDLPADFLDIKSLRLLIPNVSYGVRYYPNFHQVNIDQITEASRNEAHTPTMFAIHDQIEFDFEADQDYTAEIFYYTTVTPLSDANTSNEILVKAPDAYLYGALAATAPFLMNDERVAVWEGLYNSAVQRILADEIQNRKAGPLITRVANTASKIWR